jgi:hypothetical protein
MKGFGGGSWFGTVTGEPLPESSPVEPVVVPDVLSCAIAWGAAFIKYADVEPVVEVAEAAIVPAVDCPAGLFAVPPETTDWELFCSPPHAVSITGNTITRSATKYFALAFIPFLLITETCREIEPLRSR